MYLCASFHRSAGLQQLTHAFRAGRPWKNSHSEAATRLIWTAVIFNSSETSESVSNGVILKMYSFVVYKKSFEGQKGGSSEPPQTPPAYRPVAASRHTHALCNAVLLVWDLLRLALRNYHSITSFWFKRRQWSKLATKPFTETLWFLTKGRMDSLSLCVGLCPYCGWTSGICWLHNCLPKNAKCILLYIVD